MKSNQQGFTLIELVVVMVILGVLAATALPKFMNVNSQAHEAAVAGTGGAFGTAVAMVKATYVARGSTGAVANLVGFGDDTLDTNASGWPIATDGTLGDATDCVNLWSGLMQNPPTIASTGTATDYTAAFATNTCTYTYNGTTGKSIAYVPASGAITVTN